MHCVQALEGKEREACRFCVPIFGKARGPGLPPRCPACAEGRLHDPEDLRTSIDRGQGASTL